MGTCGSFSSACPLLLPHCFSKIVAGILKEYIDSKLDFQKIIVLGACDHQDCMKNIISWHCFMIFNIRS